jgi:hypothetical protein
MRLTRIIHEFNFEAILGTSLVGILWHISRGL